MNSWLGRRARRADTATDAESETTAAPAGAAALGRITTWLVAIYLVAVLALMVILKVTPTVDVFAALAGIGALVIGRGRAFIRDWGPFVLILAAWESMRGIANSFGQSVQSDSVIAVERFLFLGHVPTVELQRAFFQPGHVQLHDILLTFLYTSHFFFPLAFAFVLWLYDRQRYYRFIVTLLAVSFAAFLTFFVLPVAPPRFAYQYGEALPVTDVMAAVTKSVSWGGFDWIYRNLVGNPVAAFPSMHAAYPTIVLLFLAERSRRLALAWAPVMCAIWFGTVYLGHHYVLDVLGGIVYAVVAYLWVRRLMRQ